MIPFEKDKTLDGYKSDGILAGSDGICDKTLVDTIHCFYNFEMIFDSI
jgi:hypothetical protein